MYIYYRTQTSSATSYLTVLEKLERQFIVTGTKSRCTRERKIL